MIFKIIDKTQHLCELCHREKEFPKCLSDDVKFGNGKGNDNIIECCSFVLENPEKLYKILLWDEDEDVLSAEEHKAASEMIDVLLKAGYTYEEMPAVFQKASEINK